MSDQVFQCEGAPVPPGWAGIGGRHALGVSEESVPQIDFRLELPEPILGALPERLRDLVRIAAYCYLGDQSVSRGGQADVHSRKWRRRMLMALEVADLDFWGSAEVTEALCAALNFLTEDEWQFHFSPRRTIGASQLHLVATDASLHGSPGCVVLFSGGTDSLAAVLAAHHEGARPLLVSHRPSPLASGHQRRLVDELRTRLAPPGFRQVGAVINRRGSEAADASQRSRSMVFASLGAAVAGALDLSDVRLADNGVVSLNLPITDQAIGALSSRTTHPKFLRLQSRLARLVAGTHIEIRNPFWNLTRPETLAILAKVGLPDLLSETHSCAHPRGRTSLAPHCGTCSQCVDRRFGSIAAGLEEFDPAERYEIDVFRDDLKEGEPRTIATSYIRFALQVDGLPEDDFFSAFPQLFQRIDMASPQVEQEATELIAMLKRHSQSVLTVMRDQIAGSADEVLRGRLPPYCLVRLAPSGPVAQPGPARATPAYFDHSPDYSTVVFKGQTFALGSHERAAIRILHEAYKRGAPDLSGDHVITEVESRARSMSELLRRSGLWNTLVIPGARRGVYRLNPNTN